MLWPRQVLLLGLTAACVHLADKVPVAVVAVGTNYACAGGPTFVLQCWGGDVRLDGEPEDTVQDDFLTDLPTGLTVIGLDAWQYPTALATDGRVVRWGGWVTGGNTSLLSERGAAVDSRCVLEDDGRLDCGDGEPVTEEAVRFSGNPPCWLDATGDLYCEDGFRREGPWLDLDVAGEDLCTVDSDGDFSCLRGAFTEVQFDSEIAGFRTFPQHDHLPPRPRWVAVTVDHDRGGLCLRDHRGRIACFGGEVPEEVVARDGWADVDTYGGTTCAVHQTGDLVCWGEDRYGEAQAPARLLQAAR